MWLADIHAIYIKRGSAIRVRALVVTNYLSLATARHAVLVERLLIFTRRALPRILIDRKQVCNRRKLDRHSRTWKSRMHDTHKLITEQRDPHKRTRQLVKARFR